MAFKIKTTVRELLDNFIKEIDGTEEAYVLIYDEGYKLGRKEAFDKAIEIVRKVSYSYPCFEMNVRQAAITTIEKLQQAKGE